jgi:hypothetical protein
MSQNPIVLLATWLDTEPDVPDGEWYERLSAPRGTASDLRGESPMVSPPL